MQTAVAESWGVPTNPGAYDPLLASLVPVLRAKENALRER